MQCYERSHRYYQKLKSIQRKAAEYKKAKRMPDHQRKHHFFIEIIIFIL